MGSFQERITSTRGSSTTSIQAVYVPADDMTDPHAPSAQWLQVAHGQQIGSPLSCGEVLRQVGVHGERIDVVSSHEAKDVIPLVWAAAIG